MAAAKTVYIETSIVSYLTAKPSKDVYTEAWRRASVEWWEKHRKHYAIYTSSVTIEEASRGDPAAAKRRIDALSGIPILAITDDVIFLAKALIREGALPSKAVGDSLHIAVSAVHGIDFLLTWNCRHIDNAEKKPLIRDICARHNFAGPEICTPLELLGGIEND